MAAGLGHEHRSGNVTADVLHRLSDVDDVRAVRVRCGQLLDADLDHYDTPFVDTSVGMLSVRTVIPRRVFPPPGSCPSMLA
jgi:hypothetical protein